uniref:Uncharacterized protein n=1 Tax=Musca domestica TaxID=7370 RepID=A0A1I8NIR3_MUSDO
MSVTNRLLITKSLLNFTKNLRPVQRNLSAVRFTPQKQRNYVKYMLVVGGGVTAFMFANFMKTKSNRHEALNLKRMKGCQVFMNLDLTTVEYIALKLHSVIILCITLRKRNIINLNVCGIQGIMDNFADVIDPDRILIWKLVEEQL